MTDTTNNSGELTSVPSGEPPKPADSTTTQPTTTEAKPSLLNSEESKPPAAAEVVPEKYDIKVPDGYEIDPKEMEEASALFKDLGLSNEKAQKLVDFYEQKATKMAEAPYETWATMQEKWVGEIKADKELGGANLKTTLTTIGKYVDSLPNAAEFRQALDFTGAGNNPAIVRGLYHLAKQHVETASHAKGDPPRKPPASPAKALYPNLG